MNTAEAIIDNTNCKVIINGRMLKLPAAYLDRVIKASQQGLKQRAIVEKARERLMVQRLSQVMAVQPMTVRFQNAVSV